ncbi:MAG TPA: histidine kinase dimerization/phospho-acceptor domain-containing protein [Candidatus Deferrimicrobium sp.]|nr:histidine kinase dimerization/phospho-acceptor domain-containing protein [Candidatus Deferrimicrobium sp.]
MSKNLTIIIAEPNRYHARLLENELSEKFPAGAVAVFDSLQPALHELRRVPYDVAVIAAALVEDDAASLADLMQRERRDMWIILTRANGQTVAGELAKLPNCRFVEKDAHFCSAIIRIIENLSVESVSPAGLRVTCQEAAASAGIVAGTLRHEINNPLMTILGMTELILDNGAEIDRETSRKVRVIRRSAQRIQSTLTRLTAASPPGPGSLVSRRVISSADQKTGAKA